ncbi:MAG TPA: long-chain fatty acid--CoA ligase, partial [Acidimicrobiia bacterium]|nr:long-chain fatty acid--CoA ligase [Acidimicrobiia bacterium]
MSDGPAGPLLVDQLRFMAARHPDEPAYRDLDATAALTFAAWEEQSNRVARWLVERGVAPGDRVSVYLPNEEALHWIVAYAAVHKAGAVAVPTNTRLSTRELAAILGHAEIAAQITCDALLASTREVRTAVPSWTATLTTGRASDDADGWDDALACSGDEFQVRIGVDDLADIMYTSGTTGLPKGVAVRHRDVAMIPNNAPTWTGRTWLHGAPMFTFAGIAFIYNPMKMGLSGLYLPKFHVDRWFDAMEADRPMMVFLVPAMAELITAHPRFATADLSCAMSVSIGSAPLAPATLLALQDKMPDATVSNSYGLTEAGPAYIVMPKDEIRNRIGSVGKPMPPMEVKIVDPATGEECAPGV